MRWKNAWEVLHYSNNFAIFSQTKEWMKNWLPCQRDFYNFCLTYIRTLENVVQLLHTWIMKRDLTNRKRYREKLSNMFLQIFHLFLFIENMIISISFFLRATKLFWRKFCKLHFPLSFWKYIVLRKLFELCNHFCDKTCTNRFNVFNINQYIIRSLT